MTTDTTAKILRLLRERADVLSGASSSAYDDVRDLVQLLSSDQAISPVELTLLFQALDSAQRNSAYGKLRGITGTNPAAGVEITETVPTGKSWLLHSFRATLVTDATASTRRVVLSVDDGTTIFWAMQSGSEQTASLTVAYSGIPTGAVLTVYGTNDFIPLPVGIRLPAGFRLKTVTNNLQAGDNWGAPLMIVEEFTDL